jgi:uncharacterized protein (TIGR02231 family)
VDAPRASSAAADDDPSAVALVSRIRGVTVYSDRAMVTREASVATSAEPVVYVFSSLPGWVDEGSVRVATTSGRILDVRVGRRYLARSTDESFRTAEAEARALQDLASALDDELEVLAAQAEQVTDIRAFSRESLASELREGAAPTGAATATPSGRVSVETYAAVVDFVGEQLRALAKARRSVLAEQQTLRPELEASKKKLDELRSLSQVEETKVYVTLAGAGDAKLELSYLLPGATWEAAHEIRASDSDPAKVELTSYAVVTQASGEDWDDAELTFSTQSSTAAVRIPELEAFTLGEPASRSQTIERRTASYSRAESAFKGQNMLWNKRNQSNATIRDFEQSYESNVQHLEIVQSKTVSIFQTLEQRGTTTQFKAMGSTKVRADGRSVRVPIGRSELKAKPAIVAAPEQSLNAARVVELTNEAGQSILPGTVSLYQSGAFLGVTDVDFVADGEKFTLFQRVADQLKLSRVLDKKRSALVRKSRTMMQLAFVVTVENLANKPTTLDLTDRVPVSEDRDVVVSGVKLSPDAKPDSKGIVRWPVTLQAKEKKSFQIEYTIEYPPTLVLEMRRNDGMTAPISPGAPAAAPARKRPSFDVKDDIQALEKLL